jgi:4-hydroxy-2-oxoheptanedioate aldolase
MRTNAVKKRWRAGEIAYGAWLSVPSSLSAEAIAHQGHDYVCVDMQHGAIDYAAAVSMLTAIDTTGATPFVRVRSNDFGQVNQMLDAGALGVVVPMVNSVDDARAAVAACRYAPAGARSWGPVRAQLSGGGGYAGGGDYFSRANNEIACCVMIETKDAVERLDQILEVPGIDAVYVGPSDLSITLGLPPGFDNGGAFEEARLLIAKRCNARGIVAGIHANASLAAKHAAAGYRMITITSDLGGMVAAAAADLKTARG